MSQGICQKLDEMSKRIFQSQNVDDAIFESVYSKACSLVTQVAVQRRLESTAQLVRDNGTFPVRRININIKKLSKNDEELGQQGRWSRFQKQDCETLIFCTLSFSGLVLLPEEQFGWLVDNARAYLEAQSLPSGWIAREQIRNIVARTPRQANTRPFLESYHKMEIHYDSTAANETPSKRPRIETEPSSQGHPTPSEDYQLTKADSISASFGQTDKPKHSNIIEQDLSPNKHAHFPDNHLLSSAQRRQDVDPDIPHTHTQVPSQPPDQSQKEQEVISGRPANQPDESVLGLNITELLGFFQQYQASCPPLQMICPWIGVPSPSIFITVELSLGWTATLELSKQLSVALMIYIRASRTATVKVSH